MSIKVYTNMLENIVEKINNSDLKHKNSIIIGDNSSGKSDILGTLIKSSYSKYYFIDTINRTFDTNRIYQMESSEENNKNMLLDNYENVSRYRVQEDVFNLKDSFARYGAAAGGNIEAIFLNNFHEIKELVEEFLEITIEIKKVNYGVFSSKDELIINNEIDKLSNGYQAIIRLFLEIIYVNSNRRDSNITIVVDEIDEYLSPKNKAKILPFLIEKFPELNWIVTTHSANVISEADDFNLIILKENNYECLDSNDFTTITDVQEVFRDLYNKKVDSNISSIETTLRRLLSFKITDKWTEEEDKELEELKKLKLSNSQLLILHQIINW